MARIGPGVRNKPRILQDSCADCGATDPSWASVNRGILICDECCSVHRSLGRHITQIKSLKKSIWHSTQLAMVQTLNNSGANHIWEHTLLDPSTAKGIRRKPQPCDPVHPNKADFIRAKHQLMSFVYRPSREENSGGDKDVSRQLHASVRTANLETSLRLLTLGADPNYFSIEKGNCPLHVAATAGQCSQVELLVTYGADPGALDKDGLSPVDYAREGGFTDIVERLVELQYELTDRLAHFLCGKKPDHINGQHWIIPELTDTNLEVPDISKEAKSKLIALPHHSFEELSSDVYDEVDRRETESIWLSLESESTLLSDRCAVPFLPVNPEYSSTRNQGRQKLARFNVREFATLIIDILIEARRRMAESSHPLQLQVQDKDKVDVTVTPSHHSHYTLTNVGITDRNLSSHRQTCPSISSRQDHPSASTFTTTTSQSQPVLSSLTTNLHPVHQCTNTQTSTTTTSTTVTTLNQQSVDRDEDPLYDSVASEDDYSSWERKRKVQNQQELLAQQQNKAKISLQDNDYLEVESLDYEDVPETSPLFQLFGDDVSVTESPERKPKEREKKATVSLNEYLDMKRYLELSESRIKELQDNNIVMTAKLNELSGMIHTLKEENDCLRLQGSNPSLMKGFAGPHPSSYFPSNSPLHNVSGNTSGHNRSYSPFYDSPTHSFQNGDCNLRMGDCDAVPAAAIGSSPAKQQRPYSMFEARGRQQPQSLSTYSDNVDSPYVYDTSKQTESSHNEKPSVIACLPSQDEVVRKTEMITKRIQELLLAAQDSQHEMFIPCSEQINVAVRDMSDLFPKSGCPPEMRSAVHQLVMNAARLQGECRSNVTSQLHVLDPGRMTQQVIQCAYDIAKAAKNLVTHFQ